MTVEPIDCRAQWPAPIVKVGDKLTLTGFLDERRTKRGPGHYEMEAWGGHGIADDVTNRDIVTVYDPERVFNVAGVAKPPLGFNMSECSGGLVVLVKQVNGLLRWFPAGLIYNGPSGKAEREFAAYDKIHIRRLHFLDTDGTINDPDVGWLPS